MEMNCRKMVCPLQGLRGQGGAAHGLMDLGTESLMGAEFTPAVLVLPTGGHSTQDMVGAQ